MNIYEYLKTLELRIENPCVPSSILGAATIYSLGFTTVSPFLRMSKTSISYIFRTSIGVSNGDHTKTQKQERLLLPGNHQKQRLKNNIQDVSLTPTSISVYP